VGDELSYINSYVTGLVTNVFTDANKFVFDGGDMTLQSYEKTGTWTYIDDTGMKDGGITLTTDTVTDHFYFYNSGTMDLSVISFILDGQAQAANVIVVANELAYQTNNPFQLIGNFIIGSIPNKVYINGYLAVTGNTTTNADVYVGAPRYFPMYSALAYKGIYATVTGSPYGSVTESPGSIYISDPDFALDQVSSFYNNALAFVTDSNLNQTTITPNVSVSIAGVQSNTYYYAPASSLGTLLISEDGKVSDEDRAYIILGDTDTDEFDLTNVKWINNAKYPYIIYVLCRGYITNLNSVGIGYVFIAHGEINCMTGASIESPLYSLTEGIYGNPNINFTAACFLKGTKILTDRWYVPIEKLKVGDLVVTHGLIKDNKRHEVDAATLRPLKAVRRYSRMDNKATAPVCITRNAFGPNQPFEDLYVSRNHGVLRKGLLVPAGHLVNDDTIFQDRTLERVEYYHLEFDDHYAITAAGVLVESFLP
jgi:hypothetical protein